MKKVLKWVGFVLGGLLILLLVAVAALYLVSSSRINKTYDIQPETVEIPTDDAILEQGRHLAVTRGCTDCHGDNLAGDPFFEDPAMGSLYATNLTPGQGGMGSSYTDADFVRAIRHGVGPDGKPLLFMPSYEYYFYNDDDIGTLVAYIKSLPPVDNTLPESSAGPLARVLFLAGQFPLLPVELIDHNADRGPVIPPGPTAAYGEYLSVGCTGCHGKNLTGGAIPGAPPEAPASVNLTPGGNLADWSAEDFVTTMRTGVTPSGHILNVEWMPWPNFGQMTDDELQAIWLYLEGLPARADGS